MAVPGLLLRSVGRSYFEAGFGHGSVKFLGSYLSLKQLFKSPNAQGQCLSTKMTCGHTVMRSHSILKLPPVTSLNSLENLNKRRQLIIPADFNKINTRTFMEDRKTKALTIFSDLKHIKSSPMPALILGLSGLIPFVAAPAYMITSSVFLHNIAFYQAAYGASILSFLGGVRWGLTLVEESGVRPSWFNLGYSVTPSLIAWMGLIVPNLVVSNLILMAGLTGAAYFDTVMWGYPPWFKALRFMLSFVAVLSLWTTLMCKLILRDSQTEIDIMAAENRCNEDS